jgi:hypothetical protein
MAVVERDDGGRKIARAGCATLPTASCSCVGGSRARARRPATHLSAPAVVGSMRRAARRRRPSSAARLASLCGCAASATLLHSDHPHPPPNMSAQSKSGLNEADQKCVAWAARHRRSFRRLLITSYAPQGAALVPRDEAGRGTHPEHHPRPHRRA